MALSKVTLTLNSETIHRLESAASRLALPKSQIVRDAVADFYARLGQLSERERTSLLRTFDAIVPKMRFAALKR